MVHNNTLNKLVDSSHKAFGRWRKQMQVEGFTKREELSADKANPSQMSPLCRALWSEYETCCDEVNSEMVNPAQPSFGDGNDGEDDEEKPKSRGRKPALKVAK